QAIHQSISEGIELCCRSWLWNAYTATACPAKCSNSRNRGWTSQGACTSGPVHSESPELDSRSADTHQQVRRASGWQSCPFEICGFDTMSRSCVDACLPCRTANQHLSAFE